MINQTIWRYLLEIEEDVQEIIMPSVSKILHTTMMGNNIALWFIVDPEDDKVSRYFKVYGTGHAMRTDIIHDYIGTCLHIIEQTSESLVCHVFEVYIDG